MKVTTGARILGLSFSVFALSAPAAFSAQALAEAGQASTPAAKTGAPAKSPAAAQAPAATTQTVQPLLPSPGTSSQDSANDLSVTVGKSVVLDLARPITRIVVGLGDFAEATAVSPTQVLVNGKGAGETTLILWDTGGGRQFFNVTVRASTFASHDQLETVRRQLRAELPGQDLGVTTEGGNVYLRGTVSDLSSSGRAAMIAGTAGKVVNLLNVKMPPPERQILLKVRFASVDRSKQRQLGMNIFSSGFGNTIGAVSTGEFSPSTVTPGSNGAPATVTITNPLNLFAFYPGLNLGATIEAMEQKGLVESLAEPNILAQNGKQASFLAGGEYPFPMVQGAGVGGSGAVTIAFKEYGIRLNFIPTITPRGTIRLQVSPEVSALDFADAVTIAGFTEPAITVRRVKTEVELSDHQSFAIGGLLDNTENDTFVKIPFLGDIPILGKFFQTMSRTKNNSELIVIVTPEIVSPVAAGTEIALPKYPQGFLPPNSNTPMHTPDEGSADQKLAPDTIPVEQLIESMKPETPLSDGGGGGGSSYGSSGGMGSSGGSSQQQ
ncbi:MAG TPA: pilus assembly protein N-terminal domain-containing protein [Terracidiphilus sp.]|nr:pilus assembly protein N-terminal domain-containing protein [Terracidiphilus sp.]